MPELRYRSLALCWPASSQPLTAAYLQPNHVNQYRRWGRSPQLLGGKQGLAALAAASHSPPPIPRWHGRLLGGNDRSAAVTSALSRPCPGAGGSAGAPLRIDPRLATPAAAFLARSLPASGPSLAAAAARPCGAPSGDAAGSYFPLLPHRGELRAAAASCRPALRRLLSVPLSTTQKSGGDGDPFQPDPCDIVEQVRETREHLSASQTQGPATAPPHAENTSSISPSQHCALHGEVVKGEETLSAS